jgi:protein-tyrosine phosphatase
MTDLVPGAVNFRDTGGLHAGSGVTRDGVLFRSGDLSRVHDAGIAALRTLGIRRVIDLRADDEVARSPSTLRPLGATVQHVPLFFGSVTSFFANDVSLAEMYRHIVDDAGDAVVAAVRGVLADQPVLVHCTVGKDRTGVTVALMLAAAGVDTDDVVADYARTERLLPAAGTAAAVAFLRARHPQAKHLEELATRSPAPVMQDLLADVTARFGSPADYLRARGMSGDEVTELRRVLIGGE